MDGEMRIQHDTYTRTNERTNARVGPFREEGEREREEKTPKKDGSSTRSNSPVGVSRERKKERKKEENK